MCDHDLEARRARDLERYHRRTAERRAKGLCLKCGKRPPAAERTVCEPCAAKKRPADRERFHRRTVARIAQGLCPKCGKQPPAAGLIHCEPCTEKRNHASRARDARLRAAGKPRRNLETARAYNKKHSRETEAERRARGLCPRCGKAPPAPGRTICVSCGEQRRADARARYAEAKAAGKLYGGRNPESRRRLAREKSRRRMLARLDAGLCTYCGRRPPVEDGATCEPCRKVRQAAERRIYAERRAKGLCGRCGVPTFDGVSRCAPCAVRESGRQDRKNAANRRRYAERRAQGLCTTCGESAMGAAECPPCANRSYERSDYHRGMPVYPPSYTVIELATGADHGTYDSEADVSLCLAFARLSRDQVEVIADAPEMMRFAAWE